MKYCETCGKQISALNTYKTNGIIQCYDCALKTSKENLKKAGNAFTLDNKNLVEQIKNNAEVNAKTNETTKEIKPTVNQVNSNTYKTVPANEKQNDSSFWINFLKNVAKIEFIFSIIGGIIGAFTIGSAYGDFEGFLIGLVAFLGFAGASVLVLAVEMVFLNLADDVSAIRKTLTKNQEK